MRIPSSLPLALVAGLLVSTAGSVAAQTREVVSSRIAVSQRDATLELDFRSGESLAIAFREGEVLLNEESLGSYEPGGPLDESWRSLLGDVVTLNDGPLARALVDWRAPGDLDGEPAALAGRIDRTLEERLTAAQTPADTEEAGGAQTGPRGAEGSLAGLLRRTERLEALAEALEDLSLDEVRVRIGESVEVASGEVVEASLVVVDGDLTVRGTIDGNAVVTGGTLTLAEGGRITGEVRLADATLSRENGEVGGAVRNVQVARERALEVLEEVGGLSRLEELENLEELEDLDDLEEDLRREIRDEVRSELRSELRSEFRDRSGGPDFFSPLRSVARGLGGLFQNLIGFGLLVALGTALVHLFPDRLERIADTARRAPGRAGMVGLAGAFLLLPTWVLGIVALAVSIIGIPVMLAWIPLFPLAVCLAAAVGYLAVARLLGEWVAARGFRGLDLLRPSNAIHALAAGVGALLIPFAAANVVEMTGPWMGAVEGLFVAVGWVAAAAVISVGFGAVLLSRGGREPRTPSPAGAPYGEPEWPPERGPAPPPAEGDEEWEQQWADLEREARGRASGPSPEEPPEGPASPAGGPGDATDDVEPESGGSEEDEDGEGPGPRAPDV